MFDEARFADTARFTKAQFAEGASFKMTQFRGVAWFGKACFASDAMFDGARYVREAWFDEARFGGVTWFRGASFSSAPSLSEAHLRVHEATNARHQSMVPDGWTTEPDLITLPPEEGTWARIIPAPETPPPAQPPSQGC